MDNQTRSRGGVWFPQNDDAYHQKESHINYSKKRKPFSNINFRFDEFKSLYLTGLASFLIVTFSFIIPLSVDIDNQMVSKNESKITISGVPDKPGISAIIFGTLSKNNINVDMIVQNISQDGIYANLTFTVNFKDMKIARELLEENRHDINFKSI